MPMSPSGSKWWANLKEQLALTPQEKGIAVFLILSIALGGVLKWLSFPTSRLTGVKLYSQSTPADTASHPVPRAVSTMKKFPVDINSADSQRLVEIPGIGPVLAHRILKYRKVHGRFQNVAELQRVKGIGPRKLEKIKRYVVVGSKDGSDRDRSD